MKPVGSHASSQTGEYSHISRCRSSSRLSPTLVGPAGLIGSTSARPSPGSMSRDILDGPAPGLDKGTYHGQSPDRSEWRIPCGGSRPSADATPSRDHETFDHVTRAQDNVRWSIWEWTGPLTSLSTAAMAASRSLVLRREAPQRLLMDDDSRPLAARRYIRAMQRVNGGPQKTESLCTVVR